MKKYILLFLLFSIFILSSCNKNDEVNENTKKMENEISLIKAENEALKKELLEEKSNNISNVNTGSVYNISSIQENEEKKASAEDIILAGCKETKKTGDTEWCMKNTELVKQVEGYDIRFSKSIQDDSGFKGIYESENNDKLYTFEYLEKACGVYTDEGLITDSSVKETCPCPIGYHIPTPKEWKDSYLFYKENLDLFKSELGFNKTTWSRSSNGDYITDGGLSNNNQYQTSFLGDNGSTSQRAGFNKNVKLNIRNWDKTDALSIRCIKNK